MRGQFNRRVFLGGAFAALAAPAWAQDDVEDNVSAALDFFANALGEARNVFVALSDWARTGELPSLTELQRREMRREVGAIRQELRGLYMAQTQLFSQIDTYRADAPTLNAAALTARWEHLRGAFDVTLTRVNTISTQVRRARYLPRAADAQFLDQLEGLLASREGLLGQLRDLPPPRTARQLAALGRMGESYRNLHRQLGEAIEALRVLQNRLA